MYKSDRFVFVYFEKICVHPHTNFTIMILNSFSYLGFDMTVSLRSLLFLDLGDELACSSVFVSARNR